MNKKGLSPVTLIFCYLTFLFVWLMFAAEQINYWGQQAILINGLVGIDAWAYSNINYFVFIISIIFLLAGLYISE